MLADHGGGSACWKRHQSPQPAPPTPQAYRFFWAVHQTSGPILLLGPKQTASAVRPGFGPGADHEDRNRQLSKVTRAQPVPSESLCGNVGAVAADAKIIGAAPPQ